MESITNVNKSYHIKYMRNNVCINTHYTAAAQRPIPLSTVGDLIEAFSFQPYRGLLGLPESPLTLHLPNSISRSVLDSNCFESSSECDTALKTQCSLASLDDLGQDPNAPLIIKLTNSNLVKWPSDEFVEGQSLNLCKTEHVIKFLEYKINNLATKSPFGTDFNNTCLEYRLDKRLTDYVLDNEDNIKVLLAVSGSGKTRELLELLYTQFGYYFISNVQQTDFGSGDLAICHSSSIANPSETAYFIELLYFCRAFVCNHLMNLGFNSPDQILLAQIHPIAFFGCDIFAQLYESLVKRKDVVIGKEIQKISVCFDFMAIDEIQWTLAGGDVFQLQSSLNTRPFFSPLVYHTKRMQKFQKFIVAGTGIDFQCITDILQSSTVKNNILMSYKVISGLKPLDCAKVKEFIRFILSGLGGGGLPEIEIENIIERVASNGLVLGRGRFVASIVDSFIKDGDIDKALTNFITILSDKESQHFPLAFFVKDIRSNRNPFGRMIGKDTFEGLICNGMLDYMMNGKARLSVSDTLASDAVMYGIGYCTIVNDAITSVELNELAIVECLYRLTPIPTLVTKLCQRLNSECPKPQMVGYVLEYLIAYAFAARLNPGEKLLLRPSINNWLSNYIAAPGGDEEQVFFPDHCCGPDIVYKHKDIVYFIQVKFVDTISKQDRLNACHTTDPNYFYWNRKGNCVLRGFESRRNEILDVLQGVKYERFVFLHTKTTKTTVGMENVKVINQTNYPDFFDNLNPNIWQLLNRIRENFSRGQ